MAKRSSRASSRKSPARSSRSAALQTPIVDRRFAHGSLDFPMLPGMGLRRGMLHGPQTRPAM